MKVYEISFLFLKSLKVDIGQAVLIDKAYHKEDLLTVWKIETLFSKDEKKLFSLGLKSNFQSKKLEKLDSENQKKLMLKWEKHSLSVLDLDNLES